MQTDLVYFDPSDRSYYALRKHALIAAFLFAMKQYDLFHKRCVKPHLRAQWNLAAACIADKVNRRPTPKLTSARTS